MHDILFKHLEEKVTLTPGEKELITTFFASKKLKKKQFLVVEGHVCKYLSFVTKGLLKAYNTDEKGNEHINQFTPEGWWTSDMNSFFRGDISFYSIDAMEDSEVLVITSEDFENLTLQVPVMDRYFRLLFQNSLITKERRLISSYTHTAEEKYKHIVEKNPDLIKRVPQNLLASYLGLSPETLSRLKKNVFPGHK
ncbi:cyclic nucleotide-binding protein [Flavobacterium aquidurense]|uniref:Crp/Fnr family transcriptional regulator n=1 Tax=Flavobacterium aquidurense TaxID=362413 RepID=UPI0009125CF7|nr:Crp/Fnr family transcriptional regulator [Flavobacterium aquidurense]OXA67814.1 cyclic nucleotide-binding protein [Flavobacterium aquidurense]SHF96638.1 cAMP-binding domain of CRP or a regulatory subunit of cAMP-dependent protein kinases [Flavobacterium frigidimaris]